MMPYCYTKQGLKFLLTYKIDTVITPVSERIKNNIRIKVNYTGTRLLEMSSTY